MKIQIVVLCGVLLLASCGTPDSPTAPAPVPTPENSQSDTADATELAGTQWQLVNYGAADAQQTPLADAQVSINFTDTDANGSFGCNSFQGSYTVAGQQLTFSNMLNTLRACEEPIMQQEQQVSAALQAVTTFALEGDTLRLDYPDGTLVFKRAQAEANRELEGTTWELASFVNNQAVSSLIADTQITALFDNGRVSGSAGCNTYSGNYTVSNATLNVGSDIITTRMACPPEVMQQEQTFIDALAATTSYEINGTQLTLTYPDGQLVWTAQ